MCQETPFSLYLTIRKSQVKYRNQDSPPSSSPVKIQHDTRDLLKENLSLKENIQALEGNLEAFKEKSKIMEDKVASAESEALKTFNLNVKVKDDLNKKCNEIKSLKNVIKSKNKLRLELCQAQV